MANLLGYAASCAVLATFLMRTMIMLRLVGILSNLLFIWFGFIAHVYPVLLLHITLLPINLWRLIREIRRAVDQREFSSLLISKFVSFYLSNHCPSSRLSHEKSPAKGIAINRSITLGLAILAGAALSAAVVNGLNAQAAVHSAYNTPIWKTIDLGTYRNANALRDALDSAHCRSESFGTKVAGQSPPAVPIHDDGTAPYCHLEALANEIIGRPAFALSRTKSELDLVILSAFDLGFGKEGASIKDIFARAELLGFALCPPEVGPQLRLQYLDQPPGELLHIAMQPIATYSGEHVLLDIENADHGLVTFGYTPAVTDIMYSRALYVFVKPRYEYSWN
jgi:hypothetical protein